MVSYDVSYAPTPPYRQPQPESQSLGDPDGPDLAVPIVVVEQPCCFALTLWKRKQQQNYTIVGGSLLPVFSWPVPVHGGSRATPTAS